MKIKLLLITAVLLAGKILNGQSIDRIEPPSWWVGMKDQNLQIMIYGKNIGDLKPKISYKGIKLIRATCPENKNYLFIDINIGKNVKAGEVPITLNDNKGQLLKIDYPIQKRENGSADRQGFNSGDVIYLITPDRFANGDTSNDNVSGETEIADRGNKDGRHGGDIEGIRQHLDYIANLGCTAVWSGPVLENNMPKYSYHGYAITDFYKVDPRMGSNETYRSFCHDASAKGIKVIMDMVINHCGLEHWWMKDPPTKDWINNYGKPFIGTTHRKTIQLDPYAAPEDHDVFTEGWFVRTMPDLNPLNPFLGKYLLQNSIWWIEYSGIAGIRMDTYVYPDENYMTQWSRHVMSEYPNFNIAGEVWHTNPAIIAHWQVGKQNNNGYVSYLPSLFDFPIQDALRNALMTDDSGDSGWATLYERLAQDFQYANPQNMVVFADNHDMSRMYAQVGENLAKFRMANAFILTTRGTPEIYYGDEILMNSPASRDDGLIRSDFPGGWNNDRINGFTGKGMTILQKQTRDFFHSILTWRKGATAVQKGRLMQYVPEQGIYVYFRYNEEEKIMVILNKNDSPKTLKLDRFRRMLGDAKVGIEIISGKEIHLDDSLQLETAGPLIIDIRRQ